MLVIPESLPAAKAVWASLVLYFGLALRRPIRARMRRTFLGEMERRVATRDTLRPSRCPDLGDHNFGELIADLAERLFAHSTLGPRF